MTPQLHVSTPTTATVFVPVFNGRRHLEEVVTAVRRQITAVSFDLLAIDSGSTDGSLDVLRALGVRTVEIPNANFGHGRTRNLAMDLAESAFVAFLTQDATPADDGWLAGLLEPFADERVAATYGPQVARRSADVRTARVLDEVYDEIPRLVVAAEDRCPVFSDVNSCLRRTAWVDVPFRDVPYAEDFHLSQDLLRKGYAIAYAPRARVVHSNEYSLSEHFGRMVDEVASLPLSGEPVRLPWALRDWLRQVRKDARFAWRRSRHRAIADVAWAVVAEGQRSLASFVQHRSPARFERLVETHSLERRRRARHSSALSSK